MTDPIPDTRRAERTLGLVKAGVSAVPLVGGSAAELLDLVVRPRIKERRTEWLNSISEGLQDLEDRLDSFQVADLADHPAFTSAILQAGAVALRNHDEEKLAGLRNAVLNVAVSSTAGEDEHELFISLIDAYTPWHLRILAFLADKEAIADKRGKLPFPSWYAGGVSAVLKHVCRSPPLLRSHRQGPPPRRARDHRDTSHDGRGGWVHARQTIQRDGRPIPRIHNRARLTVGATPRPGRARAGLHRRSRGLSLARRACPQAACGPG